MTRGRGSKQEMLAAVQVFGSGVFSGSSSLVAQRIAEFGDPALLLMIGLYLL